ncbi:hypothetical protein DY023_07360 [Microbacterium bovistercoris]|uniref:Uncharacterized protein n=1 Tax=Microbacterium bovistercoris TaxID=2293570 RepID=A0A371NVW9_9MICO|nr:hypothetical protein [Microbacterium bovistercoris]REJ06099.1 hypothetical protein DY023_07360 [Microbacterium bovistercoris]
MSRSPPDPDASLDPFVNGLGVLSRNGDVVGHVATVRWEFHTLFSRKQQWWIWTVVIWNDGRRERPEEDYPPRSSVAEMKDGYLEVYSRDEARAGRYDFAWLQPEAAREGWSRLGITHADF